MSLLLLFHGGAPYVQPDGIRHRHLYPRSRAFTLPPRDIAMRIHSRGPALTLEERPGLRIAGGYWIVGSAFVGTSRIVAEGTWLGYTHLTLRSRTVALTLEDDE